MTAKLRRHHHELLTTFGANLKHLFLARALARTHNTGLAKLAVQCSVDPEVSGWLIKIGSQHQSAAADGENRHLAKRRNR